MNLNLCEARWCSDKLQLCCSNCLERYAC